MKKEDWKVFKCKKCGHCHGYYYMPLNETNPDCLAMDMKEFEEEFGAKLGEDGKFYIVCSKCGETVKELPFEEWNVLDSSEILGAMLEDDNRHSLTSIGNLLAYCMRNAEASEDVVKATLHELLTHYSETHSLEF